MQSKLTIMLFLKKTDHHRIGIEKTLGKVTEIRVVEIGCKAPQII